MATLSGTNEMMRQVVETHSADTMETDAIPLLSLVEGILRLAGLGVVEGTVETESMDDETSQVLSTDTLESHSDMIDRISYVLTVKASGGGDAHKTTLEIFELLSHFQWGAKLCLAVAAVALKCGGFLLLAQIYVSNQLTRSMDMSEELSTLSERLTTHLSMRFNSLNELIRLMLYVTKCVVVLEKLPSSGMSQDFPVLSAAMARIPTAAYWTMRSAVTCVAQMICITSKSHDHEDTISTTTTSEMSSLSDKLKEILEALQKQLFICRDLMLERSDMEDYYILVDLFNTVHIDNMEVLKALLNSGDGALPLFNGTAETKVGLEVLGEKNVLLLISGLYIAVDELHALNWMYNNFLQVASFETPYELLWIPIMDLSIQWTQNMTDQFRGLQSEMRWFTVNHPRLINRAVKRFARDNWNFGDGPILVVLDPQGNVVCPNALPMMWIWGDQAFPFTSSREEALWKAETWRMELIVDSINVDIMNWIGEGKYIFLYGGSDIEWIGKFIMTSRQVAQAAQIPLEMAYVGTRMKQEKVWQIMDDIASMDPTTVQGDPTMVQFFWTRLESMLSSKHQLGRSEGFEPIAQEVKRLLSFDAEGGWAVLSKGSDVVVNGHGKTVLQTLLEYEKWKEKVTLSDYHSAFKEYYNVKLRSVALPCYRFDKRKIPDDIKCPECLSTMEKHTILECCHYYDHVLEPRSNLSFLDDVKLDELTTRPSKQPPKKNSASNYLPPLLQKKGYR